MAALKSTVIPNYLAASSPRGLRRLMLSNNRRLGAWIDYRISFVNGKWFAWYYEEMARAEMNPLDQKEGGE